MSIKAAQILFDNDGYVINRIQSGGPGSVTVPEETIYEVGNYQSVGITRDIPDLSFDVEALSVNSELEAILTGVAPGALGANAAVQMADVVPIDIISPFKSGSGAFDIVRGVAIPELMLERASYRFGLRANATQSFTLRGDSIRYIPGSPYKEVVANTDIGTEIAFANTAIAYTEDGNTYYALNLRAVDTTTGNSKRLRLGDDYTNTATGFTIVTPADFPSATYDEWHVTYGSAVAASYLQAVHNTTDPAAIRGRNIDVYVEDSPGAGTLSRWTTVQSFEANWSVTLEADEEFGSSVAIGRDFQVPEVTGSVAVRAEDPADMWSKIEQIANTPAAEITGPLSPAALEVEVRLSDPDTGLVVKTFYIPDAVFSVPAISARQQTKLDTTFSFRSESGVLTVYNGIKP